MAELTWTYEAERCHSSIYIYIAEDNPRSAAEVISGVYEKAQLLCRLPQLGYTYHASRRGEIRILLYGRYRIAYLVRSADQIDIIGVFHGAMEMDRFLR